MKLPHYPAFLLVLTLAACHAPRVALQEICRQEARVTIHDASAWAAFIAEVQAIDLSHQRSNSEARKEGTLVVPPDSESFVRPFPYIVGYDYVSEHTHYSGEPQPGNTPERNNETVLKGGRKIGTLHDFEVMQKSFGYSQILSCSNSFPELYRIQRTASLK